MAFFGDCLTFQGSEPYSNVAFTLELEMRNSLSMGVEETGLSLFKANLALPVVCFTSSLVLPVTMMILPSSSPYNWIIALLFPLLTLKPRSRYSLQSVPGC